MLRDRFETMGFRCAAHLVRRLPERVAARMGRRLGGLVFRLGLRRQTSLDNLERAFGDRQDTRSLHALALASYEHLGLSMIEFLRLARLDREALQARVVLVGREHVETALALGRGAILASGHFGNWELGGAGAAAHGLPVTFVVQPLRNRRVNEYVLELRRRSGLEVLERGMALRRIGQVLGRNRLVCFMCDQDARRRGVFVPFFGTPASTPKGAAQLAVRLGVPFIPSLNRRLQDGRHEARFFPPLVVPDVEEEKAVLSLLRDFNAWLEAVVRENPDQYFWPHRRFKTAPPV